MHMNMSTTSSSCLQFGCAVNYFAHAIRHLNRPHFLAGLALPDWLSVVDRKVRLRAKRILEQRHELNASERDIAEGVLQHLEDDRWFHGTPGFYKVTGAIGAEFRKVLGDEETWRCGFLGHVVCELLLDAVLTEHQPQLLQDYYNGMADWQPAQIQAVVNLLSERQTTQLAEFIPLFVRERFLFDYQEDLSLLRRLNQVMRRVQLDPLPVECCAALSAGRDCVRHELQTLLPLEHFPEITTLVRAV